VTAADAGRLYEWLASHFGAERIFLDVNSIDPGRDFAQATTSFVALCDVLIALIGQDWLTVVDSSGRRRIDDPDDFRPTRDRGRASRKNLGIPVLVHGAERPRTEDLPLTLQGLTTLEELKVTHEDFRSRRGASLKPSKSCHSVSERTIEAWAIRLAGSSLRRISDIPGEGNPGVMVLKRGSQDVHLRGVAQLALNIVDHFAKMFPEAVIDRDNVHAGGVCHDVGKAWERDPHNQARWRADPSAAGRPSLRHPVYGAPYLFAGRFAGRDRTHGCVPFARGGQR
jgi:hypothetical protein